MRNNLPFGWNFLTSNVPSWNPGNDKPNNRELWLKVFPFATPKISKYLKYGGNEMVRVCKKR